MTRAAIAVRLALLACGGALAFHDIASGSPYALRVLSLGGIFAIATLGYQFIFGHAGALALSQGTFMGVGAYVSGILGARYGVAFDAALPASIGAPVLLALLIAIPVLRLQTHYFALATLILAEMALLVATQWESVTGGANGLADAGGLSLFGVGIRAGWPTLALVWGCVAAVAVIAFFLMRGGVGLRYALLRRSEIAAWSVGIDTARLRLAAFLLSAAYAGLAGSLYVRTLHVISPDVLGFPVMVTILTIAVVGGRRSIEGALAGAVLIIALPEWFRSLREFYLLAYGVALLAVVVVAPDGLVATAERTLARWLPDATPRLPRRADRDEANVAPSSDASLNAQGLFCAFGGVVALAGVGLQAAAGEIVGVIGPNGSGKTTTLNVITGLVRGQRGRVAIAGHDVTDALPYRIARAGVARCFQTAVLIDDATALDNVAVARRGPHEQARREAMAVLASVGGEADALRRCGELGEAARRRVEIARALATHPRLLLLDEPAAGLTAAEQIDLAARLRGLATKGIALLVIEHNVPFLASFADRLVCLVRGRVIADAPPDIVRADAAVAEAYLGTTASQSA